MGTHLSWAAGVVTSVELHRNVNNFDTGMTTFGGKNPTKLGETASGTSYIMYMLMLYSYSLLCVYNEI